MKNSENLFKKFKQFLFWQINIWLTVTILKPHNNNNNNNK